MMKTVIMYTFHLAKAFIQSVCQFVHSTSVRGHSEFSILPKNTAACRWEKIAIEPPTFCIESDRSTLQPQPQHINFAYSERAGYINVALS